MMGKAQFRIVVFVPCMVHDAKDGRATTLGPLWTLLRVTLGCNFAVKLTLSPILAAESRTRLVQISQ